MVFRFQKYLIDQAEDLMLKRCYLQKKSQFQEHLGSTSYLQPSLATFQEFYRDVRHLDMINLTTSGKVA